MARQADVPAADVLIAAIHRLAGRSDAALAVEHLVDDALAIARQHYYIVPESEQARAQAVRFEKAAQAFDLRRLARAVQSGEADQEGSHSSLSVGQCFSLSVVQLYGRAVWATDRLRD